ncbi:hypothetical protein N9D98_05855 [Amylibacter sp.]|nr:hypothetical protein [Amylibacter sp.]
MTNSFKKALISGVIILLALVPLTATSAPDEKVGKDTYKIIRNGEEIFRFTDGNFQYVTYWWDEDIWTCMIGTYTLKCYLGESWTNDKYIRD